MDIRIKRRIDRLSHEHHRAYSVGFLWRLFEIRPEAKSIDDEIHRIVGQLQCIEFLYYQKRGEDDKGYRKRILEEFNQRHAVAIELVEKLNSMIDEISGNKPNAGDDICYK